MSAVVPTTQVVGSLRALLDAWTALLDGVHRDLTVYRWQPRQPQLPCLYNWLMPSQFRMMDTGARGRDSIQLVTRVCIRHTDVNEEMAALEDYADAFRQVADPALWDPRAQLGGVPYRAQRNSMQTESVELGGVQVLCISFNLTFDLDRNING